MNGDVTTTRILLIDDDDDHIVLTRAMFADIRNFRGKVDAERSYAAALARLDVDRHDIYFVDYRIGPESGIDWIRAAHARGVVAPIILLTGQGSHDVDLAAMAAGAADYLIKSEIDGAQLERAVRYALDRARYVSAIGDSEARYRQLFERVPLPMLAYDRETLRFVAVNDAAVAHYGYSRDEFLELTALQIRPPEDVELFRTHLASESRGLRTVGPYRHTRKDGSIISVEIVAHDAELFGRECRLVLAKDVTDQLEVEAHLRLLASAFESSKSGMVVLQASTDRMPIIHVNPAFLRMMGRERSEVIGETYDILVDVEPGDEAAVQIRAALQDHRDCEAVVRGRRKDGLPFWHQVTLAPVRDADDRATHFIVVSTDLTEQRRQEAEVVYLARHDTVTGLPRFNGADEAIQPLLDAASPTYPRVALFHVDIDRFQTVNESVGYRGGDETLHLLAQRMRYIAGERGRVWRAGGDEFLIAMPHNAEEDDPLRMAEDIREWLEIPVDLPSGKLHLSGTVGSAVFPDHATTAEDLVQCTDAALRRAKRGGRNSTLSFAEGQTAELRDRIALRGRLRSAIANEELVLHFQPQVRASDGRIVGAEALVRWNTRDHGLLLPGRFIPMAEELGVIIELGRWVLRNACLQAARWRDAGHDDIRVAVNVSALQLHRMSFLDEVCEALDAANLPAQMLDLELTETALMENVARASDILHGLRDLGVYLALDDFGIGYSCLSQLKRFPIDMLKIDRSFVEEIASNSGGAAIARAITAMGHELHMKVLAEGVETEAQLGYLLRNHCDEFQGYLFGKPQPADAFTDVLTRRYVETSIFERTRPGRELLLIDDEENILRALARLLRRDGYTIHTATNATEGFDILARQRIQVIVSDQRMPGMSGTEFLSRVKEMYPDTVRIILSGYTDLTTVTDAINRGAIYKFLTKPWNDEEVRGQVQDAFRRHSESTGARA